MAATADGVLLVDKPVGITSHDVVATVRRARGRIRTGHLGTLDPFASGLLVVTCGRATRLARYIPAEPKVYRATIRFGTATDTDDGTGVVIASAEVPGEDAIRRAIPALTGEVMQRPPDFSAKHAGGQRAYVLARRGEDPGLSAVPVRVDRWEVLEWTPPALDVVITCGSGTYIRALARDLGRATESAAHLAALRRTRVGRFDVGDASAPDETGDAVLVTPADALAGIPRQVLSVGEAGEVRHGRAVVARTAGEIVALVDGAGALLAVAGRDRDWLQPRVVLDAA
jgi:tRNA pseudouridine55 synthase